MIPSDTIEKVLSAIDPEELIALTADLVRINSVWDPVAGTDEENAAAFVAQWAEKEGLSVQVDQVAPGRPNVVLSSTGSKGKRTLMFEGHSDVVTPGDHASWQYDPFGAEIVGRCMYGRGTNDTKGNLAAMLIAMAALKRTGVSLAGKIVGGVLCDEEDQMLGVQDFIRRGHADSVTAAVICEPEDGLVCISQKGAIRAQYILSGRMSHGAMPLSGLNTAPAVARLIDGLHNMEWASITILGRDDYLGWPSFTPTVIQAPFTGAPQLNVMPEKARVLVDIRTIPSQSHPELRAQLQALAKDVERQVRTHYQAHDWRLEIERPHDLTVEVSFLTDRPCTLTDTHDPIVKAAKWATKKVTDQEAEHAGVPGATDGTYLWALKNIPIVTMGAGLRHVAHQVDEWVDLDQLIETAKIYALTALHYLHPGD